MSRKYRPDPTKAKGPSYDAHADRWVRLNIVNPMARAGFVTVMWTGVHDWKTCLEIGLAITLGKPMVILCQAGVELPASFRSYATKTVWADLTTEEGCAEGSRLIGEAIQELKITAG